MRKPRLFIASSVETLPVAEAVNVNLDYEFEVTIWKSGTFNLSSTTIDDLVQKSSCVDFALFIFAPDDIAVIKDKKEHIVRDNVIFEMGLFVGAIGKSRSFILKPRDTLMHLPTDLLGITPADYDASRSDNDLVSATNRACSLIKSEVERLGLIDHTALSESKKIISNPTIYELKADDYKFLSLCLTSYTNLPVGIPIYEIFNKFRDERNIDIQISLIKLERMGYLSKSIETDHNGYDFFSYSITEMGIDELIKNENLIYNKESNSSEDFDDKIPF